MAQIIKRGTNRYLIRVFLGRDGVNGRRRYHSKTIRGTKKQAEAYGTRIQFEVDTGVFRKAAVGTVGEFLDQWVEGTAKRRVRARTCEGYRQIIDTCLRPIVGAVKLSAITHEDAQRVVDHLEEEGKSPRTIRNVVGVLRNAMTEAVKLRLITENPAKAALLTLPRLGHRPMTVLAEEQALAFIEAAKKECRGLIFILLLVTGMRPGEAMGLKWEDFQGGILRVRRSHYRPSNADTWIVEEPKTKRSRRSLPVPQFLVDMLEAERERQEEDRLRAGEQWQDHGFIFTDENGEPLRWQHMVRTVFRNILAEAGLPKIRGYDLRHTCATLLLAAGVNPKVVSERLGHSTVALTLDTYSFVLPGLQEEATAKLEGMLG